MSALCLCLFLCLLLPCFSPHAAQAQPPDINIHNVWLNVSPSSGGLRVSWQNPDHQRHALCYDSELQHRTTCETAWQAKTYNGVPLTDWVYLMDPDRRRSYVFRLRMKYRDVCSNRTQWSAWTPHSYWGNPEDTGSCTVDSEFNSAMFNLTILPLSGCFLLLCIFSQKRVRRFFFPYIPDPKHLSNSLHIIQQWQSGFSEPAVDCETVDIEIVSLQQDAEQKQEGMKELEGGGLQEERSTITQSACLSDTGLQTYPSLAENGAYCTVCLLDRPNAHKVV